MQTQILNYRIIIEPEKIGKKVVYNAACHSLGVFDYGNSVEEALESIKGGIELAIEYLVDEGQEIPIDNLKEQIVTKTEVHIPAHAKLAAA